MVWPTIVSAYLAVQSTSAPIPTTKSELDALAERVRVELSSVQPSTYSRDPMTSEFMDTLNLVADWPHPIFRTKLQELVGEQDPWVVSRAAQAIANYRDEHAMAILRTLEHDQRTIVAGCFGRPLSEDICKAIATVRTNPSFEIREGAALPFETGDYMPFPTLRRSFPTGMTVDRAAELLKAPELPIRLQAYAWLAWHGIVLDTEPLEAAWRVATAEERAGLFWGVGRGGYRVGRVRLRAAFEKLARGVLNENYSSAVRSAIANGLGRVESRAARDFAIPIIAGEVKTPFTPREITVRLPESHRTLLRCLDACIAVTDVRDLEEALAWTNSPNAAVASAGFCILSRLDDERAVRKVEERLLDCLPLGAWSLAEPSICGAISSRRWENDDLRWRYVTMLGARMKRIAADIPVEGGWDSRLMELDSLIHTLEALARTNNGPDSFTSPGFSSSRAIGTANAWDKWIRERIVRRAVRESK